MPPPTRDPVESMLLLLVAYTYGLLGQLLAQDPSLHQDVEQLLVADLASIEPTEEGGQQVSSEVCVNETGSPIATPRERSRSPRR